MLGFDPIGDPTDAFFASRVGWQTYGQPSWGVADNICVTMATTDGRHFARLGIQSYGYTPMELPAGYDFATMAHGADERIPVGAVDWGTEAVYRVLETYAG